MRLNKWTMVLAAAGVVSSGSVFAAEETMHPVNALSPTVLSGYVDTSAIWQFGRDKVDTGRSFDRGIKQNNFNLNVVKLALGRPLDEGQWAAGYQVDLLFGPDARGYNPSTALDFEEFGIKQAYVALRAPLGNDLDLQFGTFDSIIGFEGFDSVSQLNYSRSYGYAIEPIALTGLLATYNILNDKSLSISAGVANAWGAGINSKPVRGNGTILGVDPNSPNESNLTYMGRVYFRSPESWGFMKDLEIWAGIVDGLGSANGPIWYDANLGGPVYSSSRITSYYAGMKIPTPFEPLKLGLSYDYRGTKADKSITTRSNSTYASAIAFYITYQITSQLAINNRAELATGTLGTWSSGRNVDGFGNLPADREQFFADTFTVDYKLWGDNVMSRVEFRWDHDMAGAAGLRSTATGANNAASVALNLIYKF